MNVERIVPALLLTSAFAASAWLGMRQMELRSEVAAARAKLDQEKNGAAVATLNSIAMPGNGRLSACNDAGERMHVTALAGVFADDAGRIQVFNSARNGWRTWEIAPGATERLDMREDGSEWDGRALFYAMDVAGAGREQLLTGTANDLKRGCVALSGRHEAGKN
jgi:hypothetical protein